MCGVLAPVCRRFGVILENACQLPLRGSSPRRPCSAPPPEAVMSPVVRQLSLVGACAVLASGVWAQTPPSSDAPPDTPPPQQQSRLVAALQQQQPVEPPPAHLAMVDGAVALERGAQSEDAVDG